MILQAIFATLIKCSVESVAESMINSYNIGNNLERPIGEKAAKDEIVVDGMGLCLGSETKW